MLSLYTWFSFLPIVVLLVVSLWKGVKTGIYVGLLVTVFLFFWSGTGMNAFWASFFSAFIGTINILMIIFGAVFLYHIMEQKGYIDGIKHSLASIHPSKSFRFFFLGLFLAVFFESVAGFGTPGAIIPLLLISMGFPPVLSIAVVLLFNGFFAVSGAIGTPVIAGLETPLGLAGNSIAYIYLYASLSVLFAGIIVMAFVYKYLTQETIEKPTKKGWILYFVLIIPFVLLSFFLKELTGLVAGIIMALAAYIFMFKNKNFDWKPWIPYIVLILLLLLPKIFPGFGRFLAYRIDFNAILGTDVSATLQPLRSPLIPFLASAVFALYRVKDYKLDLKPVVSKTFTVFLILFPSLAITQLMMNSGQELPSMIEAIASVFVQSGAAYPAVSPLIGVVGAFITGSTTVSNIIFGPVQYNAALSLNLKTEIILGLQLAGASLGNAICLFNIIAAAAVAGVKNYNSILKKNLLPVILASIICSLVGFALLAIA